MTPDRNPSLRSIDLRIGKQIFIALVPFSLPRRSRCPDPARAKRVLGESRRRASLDSSAAAWISASPGNSARTEIHMTKTTLYTNDSSTATGIREATFDEILSAAREQMSLRVRRGTSLTSPKATRDFLALKLGSLEREVFAVIFLDKRHRLISYQEMFQGTIDGATVHPREVVKEALKQNAAAVILAHPHPSGVAEPSQADEFITQRLKDALSLVDIRVLDHIIIAGGDTISLAEKGLL
jgi:DNA repair protein RadC